MYPALALSRENAPGRKFEPVVREVTGHRSQVRVLPASDRVTGDPLFLKESSS
jgi:hypothetical protein